MFGENLTAEGSNRKSEVSIGGVLQMGSSRGYCNTTKNAMLQTWVLNSDEWTFSKCFWLVVGQGSTLRCSEEGEVGAGDAIEQIEKRPQPNYHK